MSNKPSQVIKEVGQKVVSFLARVWGVKKTIWKQTTSRFQVFFGTKTFSVIKKIAVALVVLLALAQFVFAIAIYGLKTEDKVTKTVGKLLPFPVAVVNLDAVTYDEYQEEKDYIHHFYSATDQEGGIDYKTIDSQILDQLIENKIVRYEAFANKISVSKVEVDEAVNNIAIQNGGEDNVKKVLSDLYGLSLSDFRRLVKTQMLRDKINNTLITHVTARHILIQVPEGSTDEQVQAAQSKIGSIKSEIEGGLDFSEAAKKYSEDAGSAANGGLLEPFSAGDLVPGFSEAAFSAEIGSITEPVQTEYGWHLIKVESRTGSIDKSFAEWLYDIENGGVVLKFYNIG